MHPIKLPIVFLALTAASGFAQFVSAPDADGIYSFGKGLTPAEILNAPVAAYPPDASLGGVKHVCNLTVVVRADGKPGKIESKIGDASPFEDGAIAALEQLKFKPAMFQGHPVASRLTVYVPFVGGKIPPVPISAMAHPKEMKEPVPLNRVETQFPKGTDVQGISLVSLVVAEDGTVKNARVIRSLGPEFDESALTAMKKCRFKPAMLYGVPMAMMITVEINFRKN
jgi:TonB family protein